MNIVIEMDITDNQLKQLNFVRQWFNVKYLSEIFNEEGIMFRPGIKNGSHICQIYTQDSDGPKK